MIGNFDHGEPGCRGGASRKAWLKGSESREFVTLLSICTSV